MKYALMPVKVAAFVVGVVILGIGVPLLWVFIASKLSDTFLKVPLLPLLVMGVPARRIRDIRDDELIENWR